MGHAQGRTTPDASMRDAVRIEFLLAVVSATQDIAVDAYRTDLLPDRERGAGAAATNLGYRAAMLAVGAGGFILAGRYDWPLAFLFSAVLMLAAVVLRAQRHRVAIRRFETHAPVSAIPDVSGFRPWGLPAYTAGQSTDEAQVARRALRVGLALGHRDVPGDAGGAGHRTYARACASAWS